MDLTIATLVERICVFNSNVPLITNQYVQLNINGNKTDALIKEYLISDTSKLPVLIIAYYSNNTLIEQEYTADQITSLFVNYFPYVSVTYQLDDGLTPGTPVQLWDVATPTDIQYGLFLDVENDVVRFAIAKLDDHGDRYIPSFAKISLENFYNGTTLSRVLF